ncbi:hypothetical protein C2I18_27325 [Paenibacillus sp. PK3_47]|uniref:hypothetical protein n=1 Tax=Paenibacillus sp. PK3_47 TaxID=2072642 RepID=UPI00201E1389|nr:hypothetical protein [Paenibacillus sp. PK3_47]UQZ36918.1 hypothetical protein C2I18_27325 [Paenibacillus sp. PK3_47]
MDLAYFIAFLLTAFLSVGIQRYLKKEYGTSAAILLLRKMRKLPKDTAARKKLIRDIVFSNAIGLAGLILLLFSLAAFWDALKTIGP